MSEISCWFVIQFLEMHLQCPALTICKGAHLFPRLVPFLRFGDVLVGETNLDSAKKPREITLPGFRSKTPSQIFPSVLTWGWEEQGLGQWQCISTQHLPE